MAKGFSTPNGIVPQEWNDSSDTYTHVDIKGWLQALDAAVGALMADRQPLGTVQPWSFPDKTSPDSSSIAVPTGWAVCNGQTITSANHDFPAPFAGGSIVLPNYLNCTLIGADPTKTLRVAGTESTNPGIKGRQGANTDTVPDHYHYHQHDHALGTGSTVDMFHGIETDNSSSGLNDSEHSSPHFISTDASGSGYFVELRAHAHSLAQAYTSNPRDPASANLRQVDASSPDGSALTRYMTTLQVLWDGSNGQTGSGHTGSPTITPGGGTNPSGNTTRDSLNISTYQQSEAVYFIMKVKWGSDYSRPWAIRNPDGTTGTVGQA